MTVEDLSLLFDKRFHINCVSLPQKDMHYLYVYRYKKFKKSERCKIEFVYICRAGVELLAKVITSADKVVEVILNQLNTK